MTDFAPTPYQHPYPLPNNTFDPRRLVEAFFRDGTHDTQVGRQQDLNDLFCRHLKHNRIEDGVRQFFSEGSGSANCKVLEYRDEMLAAGLKPATVNRRLCSIRSLASLGNLLGIINWSVGIRNVRTIRYRDVSAPTDEEVHRLYEAIDRLPHHDAQKKRNRAIVCLMTVFGLRRVELARLEVRDLDFEQGVIWVHGKGRLESEDVEFPVEAMPLMREWLDARDLDVVAGEQGLLISYSPDSRYRGRRLTRKAYNRILEQIANEAEVRFNGCHSLRRTGINTAHEEGGRNAADTQGYARHAKFDDTVGYLKRANRRKSGLVGKVAKRLLPASMQRKEGHRDEDKQARSSTQLTTATRIGCQAEEEACNHRG